MTTRGQIGRWFDQGRADGYTHMIVVVDLWDHEDFPVYVAPSEDPRQVYNQYAHKKWTNVMEVYDLAADRDTPLAEHRAMHLPARTEATS